MSLRKKILSLALLVTALPFLGWPAVEVKAQTTDNQLAIRAELRSLMNELRVIRATLNELLARIKSGTASNQDKQKAENLAVTLQKTVEIMSETYRPGDKGSDILDLQKFLNENPYTQIVPSGNNSNGGGQVGQFVGNNTNIPNTPGHETGIFDEDTSDALRRYQELLSVVSIVDLINKYKDGSLADVKMGSFLSFVEQSIKEAWGNKTVFAQTSVGTPFSGKIVEVCGPEKCKFIQNGTDCSQRNQAPVSYTIFRVGPPGKSDPYVAHLQGYSTGNKAGGGSDPAACTAEPATGATIVGSVDNNSITLNTNRDEKTKKCTGQKYGPGKVISKCSNVVGQAGSITGTGQVTDPSASNSNNFGKACNGAAGSSCPSCGGSNGSKNSQDILSKLLGQNGSDNLLKSLSGKSDSGSGSGDDSDDNNDDDKDDHSSNATSSKNKYNVKFRRIIAEALSGPLTPIAGPEIGAIAIFDRSTTDSTYEPGLVGVCLNSGCSRIVAANYKNNKYQARYAPTGRTVSYFKAPSKKK